MKAHFTGFIVPLATLVLSTLAISLPGLAAPGDLDASFGTAGIVTTDIGGANDLGISVAVGCDGKIVVAGTSIIGGREEFALARYTMSGDLDTGFGDGGKLTTGIGANSSPGRAVALRPDGKIVVAGYSNNGVGDDFAVARYLDSGVLDPSFGCAGKVTTNIASADKGQSVAVQSDGKIVVAGNSDTDFALVRYTETGLLDSSFGTGGKVILDYSANDLAYGMAVQNDGKILLVGSSASLSTDVTLLRYTNSGTPDNSFGSGGVVATSIGTNAVGRSVAVQGDGKIVVAGYRFTGALCKFVLVRYTDTGVLDPDFGSPAGIALILSFGLGHDHGYSVAVQDNGKILVCGDAFIDTNYDFATARYLSDGDFDPSFGTNGKVTTDIAGFHDTGQSIAVQNDGKIVVAGYSRTFVGPTDIVLMRYEGDPQPPGIVIEQPAGNVLADGQSSVKFGAVPIGGNMSREFTVRNKGGAALAGLAVSVDGTNHDDFSLGALGSSALAQGESTTFLVEFAPAAEPSGSRTAAIHITSDDAGGNPIDITLTGQAFSTAADFDSDGLNDWGEQQLAVLGFDWRVSQEKLVQTLGNGASAAGYFSLAQVQALNITTPLLQRDIATGIFTLKIGVERAVDLSNFQAFPLTGTQLGIAPAGELEIQFSLPGDAAFFRLRAGD